jgi:tetratricopeptide (TPR) repeat protein
MLIVCFFPFCCRCVLELHAIAKKVEEEDGRFAITMTRKENVRFLADMIDNDKDGHKQYYSMIGRVNAETSECSRASDRESIHEGIRRSVGFAKLNRMVFGILEGWMVDQFKFQIEANETTGNKRMALKWKALLGMVLTEQGRYDEACVIHEANLKTLDVAQRQLWHLSEDAVANEMTNLANAYTRLGRNEDALALYEKAFDIYNRALPADDPQISETSC